VDSRVKIKDVAAPWDANIESKCREKGDLYKDLAIALQVMEEANVNYSSLC